MGESSTVNMAFNAKGRFYVRGTSLSEEKRGEIIDALLEEGGDSRSGYFPGNWSEVGSQFRVHGKTVKDVWNKFVTDGTASTRKRISGNPPKLGAGEIQLVEAIKTQKPSTSYKRIREELLLHSNLPAGISKSSIGRRVRTSLCEGKWTWKRMSRNVTHKFTQANVDYCQDFLDYMHQVDPSRLKFFDESGVSLYDCNKRYGHSLVSTPCIEIGRYMKSPNITLNMLCGLDGVLYANTVDVASDTVEFLTFFDEASKAVQPNGYPVLMADDIIVLDNCPTHHNAGGFVLGQWLDTMGVDVVYLPTYSPEFNPAELVFQKMKIVLKREDFEPLVNANLHAAIYAALDEITANDMAGFYRNTGYIFV